MFSKNSFDNKGQSLIIIIIVLVMVALIGGGFYYYFSEQTPEIPEELIVELEPELKPEKETKIAPIYPGAAEISTPPEVRERLLSLNPEAEIVSYLSVDSSEKIEEWYRLELTAEGWQETAGNFPFSQWEKDKNVLVVEVGALSKAEAEEMGNQGANSYILLYRSYISEPKTESEVETKVESKTNPEPKPEIKTDQQLIARTHIDNVAEILKTHEKKYGEFIIWPKNDEPKAGDLIPDPPKEVGFAYNITPSLVHLFATEETQPYFEHQIPKEGAIGWCWVSSTDTITFETWDKCLNR